MVEYKCFSCGKTVSDTYTRKKVRCPYCGSKMLYKSRATTTPELFGTRLPVVSCLWHTSDLKQESGRCCRRPAGFFDCGQKQHQQAPYWCLLRGTCTSTAVPLSNKGYPLFAFARGFGPTRAHTHRAHPDPTRSTVAPRYIIIHVCLHVRFKGVVLSLVQNLISFVRGRGFGYPKPPEAVEGRNVPVPRN